MQLVGKTPFAPIICPKGMQWLVTCASTASLIMNGNCASTSSLIIMQLAREMQFAYLLLLALDIVIDRRLGHAQCSGDVVQRRVVEALGVERARGSADDDFALE